MNFKNIKSVTDLPAKERREMFDIISQLTLSATIGDMLKQICAEKELTFAEAEEQALVDPGMFSKIAEGAYCFDDFTLDHLSDIAWTFGYKLDFEFKPNEYGNKKPEDYSNGKILRR